MSHLDKDKNHVETAISRNPGFESKHEHEQVTPWNLDMPLFPNMSESSYLLI